VSIALLESYLFVRTDSSLWDHYSITLEEILKRFFWSIPDPVFLVFFDFGWFYKARARTNIETMVPAVRYDCYMTFKTYRSVWSMSKSSILPPGRQGFFENLAAFFIGRLRHGNFDVSAASTLAQVFQTVVYIDISLSWHWVGALIAAHTFFYESDLYKVAKWVCLVKNRFSVTFWRRCGIRCSQNVESHSTQGLEPLKRLDLTCTHKSKTSEISNFCFFY